MTEVACPWPGPQPYDEGSQRWLKGRDEELKQLIEALAAQLLTVQYAASGVGKTSLLRAGLVPQLRALRHRDLLELVSRSESEDEVAATHARSGYPLLVRQWTGRSQNSSFDELLREQLIAALDSAAVRHQDRISALEERLSDGNRLADAAALDRACRSLRVHRLEEAALSAAAVRLRQTVGVVGPSDGSQAEEWERSLGVVSDVCDSMGSIVLILDQFEEILGDARLGQGALAAIDAVYNRLGSTVRQVISMRREFLYLLRPLEVKGTISGRRYLDLPAFSPEKVRRALSEVVHDCGFAHDDQVLDWLVDAFSTDDSDPLGFLRGDGSGQGVNLLGLQAFLNFAYYECADHGLKVTGLPAEARERFNVWKVDKEAGSDDLGDEYLKQWLELAIDDSAYAFRGVAVTWPGPASGAAFQVSTSSTEEALEQAPSTSVDLPGWVERLPVGDASGWSAPDRSGTRANLWLMVRDRDGAVVGKASLALRLDAASNRWTFDKLESCSGELVATAVTSIDELMRPMLSDMAEWLVSQGEMKRPMEHADLLREAFGNALCGPLAPEFVPAGIAAAEGWDFASTWGVLRLTLDDLLERLVRKSVLKRSIARGKVMYELVHDRFARPLGEWKDDFKKTPGYILCSVLAQQGRSFEWQSSRDLKKWLAGRPISNARWVSCVVVNTDFSGVAFRDCHIERVEFRNCIFGGEPDQSALGEGGAEPSRPSVAFGGGSLQECRFHDCSFTDLTFKEVDLRGIDVRAAEASPEEHDSASESRSRLDNVHFVNVDLEGARFARSTMRGCGFFEEAGGPERLAGRSYRSMRIEGGSIADTSFVGDGTPGHARRIDWASGAIADCRVVGPLQFTNVDMAAWSFGPLLIEQPTPLVFDRCRLAGAVVVKTTFPAKEQHGSESPTLTLTGCDLPGSMFIGCRLDHALFDGSAATEGKPSAESLLFIGNCGLGDVAFKSYDAPGLTLRDVEIVGYVSFEDCDIRRGGFERPFFPPGAEAGALDLTTASTLASSEIRLLEQHLGVSRVRITEAQRNWTDVYGAEDGA